MGSEFRMRLAILASVSAGMCALLLVIWGCQMRPSSSQQGPKNQSALSAQSGGEPSSTTPSGSTAAKVPVKKAKVLPPLNAEPLLDVLLQHSGQQAAFTLLSVGEVGGRRLNPGSYRVQLQAGAVVLLGQGIRASGDLRIDLVNKPTSASFSLAGQQAKTFGGDLVIKAVDGKLAICEQIALKIFCQVSWSKRWEQAGHSRPSKRRRWRPALTLRVNIYVGMIFPGIWLPLSALIWPMPGLLKSASAIEYGGDSDPRRPPLVWRSPLTAWFHSCSGGKTAGKNEAFATRMAADGVTDPAPPCHVDDPWAERGAIGLRRPTVFNWQWRIKGDALSWRIRQKALAESKVLALGRIKRIDILSRYESGRANKLRVIHDGAEGSGSWLIDAYQFRLWAGSHDLRSTWITSLSTHQGELFFAGRGFGRRRHESNQRLGHGSRGQVASQIFGIFTGATFVSRW